MTVSDHIVMPRGQLAIPVQDGSIRFNAMEMLTVQPSCTTSLRLLTSVSTVRQGLWASSFGIVTVSDHIVMPRAPARREFCSFQPLLRAQAVQKPHPPIWMGGESPAALRRPSRRQYPIGNNPTYPMGTLAQVKEAFAQVQENAAEAGDADVGLAYNSPWLNIAEASTAPDGSRQCTGAGSRGHPRVRGRRRDLILRFPGATHEETLASLDRFAEEVMARL